MSECFRQSNYSFGEILHNFGLLVSTRFPITKTLSDFAGFSLLLMQVLFIVSQC